MERLDNLVCIPTAAIRFLSKDPAEKTWICKVCGVVPPFALNAGWYARRKCACERLAEEQQAIQAMQHLSAQARARYVYTWLGSSWPESGLSGKTFATFQRERHSQAFDLVYSFAQNPHGVLALYGSFGTGKTHLLAAVANHLGAKGISCLFASAVTLFDAIQDRIQQDQDYLELFRRGIQAPLLLLDDVDKLKPSEFREEVLFKLVNGRTNAGRPLAISSNCTPGELERWVGKAGRSRLMMGLVPVQMNGTDYRLEMQQ